MNNPLMECDSDCEKKFRIEPHGNGYALYVGACMHKHGYNIAHITEADEKTIALIERALNKLNE